MESKAKKFSLFLSSVFYVFVALKHTGEYPGINPAKLSEG